MKIAYFISSRKKKGPVIVVRDLVRLFSARGHECTVYYFDESDEIEFDCPMRQITLRSVVDFSQYDVVHCHGGRPNIFVTLHKPLFCKARFFTSIHSYIFQDFYYQYGKWKYLLYGWIVLFFTTRFDKVLVSSKDALRYYRKLIPWKKVDYSYNTIFTESVPLEEEEKKTVSDFKGEDLLIGCSASLNLRKGQHLLIEALPRLPGFKLFLLGTGPAEAYYRDLVRKHHLEDRVFFRGFRMNWTAYLPFFDIYAMPSFSEGCPLALLEAAAFGSRVVSSNIPVLVEMFGEDEAVFFDIKDPAGIPDAVREAMKKDGLREHIKARFDRDYSHEAVYSRMYGIYRGEEGN